MYEGVRSALYIPCRHRLHHIHSIRTRFGCSFACGMQLLRFFSRGELSEAFASANIRHVTTAQATAQLRSGLIAPSFPSGNHSSPDEFAPDKPFWSTTDELETSMPRQTIENLKLYRPMYIYTCIRTRMQV